MLQTLSRVRVAKEACSGAVGEQLFNVVHGRTAWATVALMSAQAMAIQAMAQLGPVNLDERPLSALRTHNTSQVPDQCALLYR